MILTISVLAFFTLLCIAIGCWATQNDYKDTSISAVIGAFCFGVPMVFALFEGVPA